MAPAPTPVLAPRPARPVGVLLVNIGSPASPAVADVRAYLGRFLNDPRVIDLPPVARWLLLHLIILPLRPRRSARAYARIWTPAGSPLVIHGHALAQALGEALGPQVRVELGMLYGAPSLDDALDRLAAAGVDDVLVVPLYPQYAGATTGAALERVGAAAAARWVVPNLSVLPPFYAEDDFLDALAAVSRPALVDAAADHVLMSFHGVPVSHCTRTDPTQARCQGAGACCDAVAEANRHCYRAQCFATARALAERLGLAPEGYTVAFQSRLGRTPWIGPYTDETLDRLAAAGVRRLAVLEPSFVADCLETLEEVGIAGRERFRSAGGEELILVPCLNADPAWVEALARLVRGRLPAGPIGRSPAHEPARLP